jgi:hypothetical protein
MSIRHSLRVSSLVLGLVSLAACGASTNDGAAPSGEPMRATGSYTLRSDVAQLDAATWDAAVVPHEGAEIWLKPESRDAAWLTPGAVTVFKGRGVLKVGSVREEGDHLVVENVPANYNEFIENGAIAIAGAARFEEAFDDDDSDLGVKQLPGTDTTKPQTVEDPLKEKSDLDGLGKSLNSTVKTLLTDGWKLEKSVHGNGDKLHYEITMTKDSGGLLARLHVRGVMNNLATAFEVAVQNRTTSRQTFDVHTSGEADLDWEIGITEGSVGYKKILLPGVAYRRPFFIGDVPMVLKVKSSFALVVGATGRNTTTTGRIHVTYSSDGGVQVSGGAGDSNATGTGDASYADDKGTLAVGPSAFGFVATLPKVELGVGVDKLFVAGTYFSNTSNTYVEAVGALGGSPCANIETKLTGRMGLFLDAGLGGSLLQKGLQLTEDNLSKELYAVERKARTCGLK